MSYRNRAIRNSWRKFKRFVRNRRAAGDRLTWYIWLPASMRNSCMPFGRISITSEPFNPREAWYEVVSFVDGTTVELQREAAGVQVEEA